MFEFRVTFLGHILAHSNIENVLLESIFATLIRFKGGIIPLIRQLLRM